MGLSFGPERLQTDINKISLILDYIPSQMPTLATKRRIPGMILAQAVSNVCKLFGHIEKPGQKGNM